MRRAILCGVFFLVSGCGSTQFHGPDQFASSTDVFNDFNKDTGFFTSDFPVTSQPLSRSEFEVGFEDVFRAAEVSAVQAQFFIDKVDKDNGLIYASRNKPIEQHIGRFIDEVKLDTSGWVISEKRFFLISVREIDGEKTAVEIFNKVQYECRGATGMLHSVEECKKLLVPHWPNFQQGDVQSLQQYISFVRNNLMSAGLI